MKRRLSFVVITTLVLSAFISCSKSDNQKDSEIKDEGTVITDVSFKKFCYDRFDTNKDGKIDGGEVGKVTEIIVDNNDGIVTLQGIHIFQNLRSFSANQCTNLKDANLNNNPSLAFISFANCTSLTSVTLPESTKSISARCFFKCYGLTTINIPQNISSIGDYAFAFCSGISTFNIPSSVKSIGAFAFQGCMNLKSVLFSEGLETIGEQAFYNCTGITSISFPSTVTDIGEFLFVSCTGLKTVFCKPKTPPYSKGGQFMGCYSLASISVPAASVNDYKKSSSWREYASKIVGSTAL